MKELKLLPEDWKGEVEIKNADFAVCLGTICRPHNLNFHDLPAEATYYKIATNVKTKAIELKPEARPADSIKLSECDGRHLITLCSLTKMTVRLEGCKWQARNMKGIAKHPPNESLTLLLTHFRADGATIYDMTQD